jgi:RNA polymerase sigma factor (sigma-70 family)
MMGDGYPKLLARLRTAVGADLLSAAPDADLLARFAQDRDEAAFAELVRRHGPRVLAECRRVVPEPSAADDVFQAAFLVLARRANEIRHPEYLGGWLHGVANRIARRVRRRVVRRSAAEQPLASVPEPHAPTVPQTIDLRDVLDEELNRLPALYREAVGLCDVDGLSRRAAASRLGIPESTLSNRLTRARALLGRRLLRRGVALGAGLMAAGPADGAVTERLVDLVTRTACADTVPAELSPLLVAGSLPMPNAKRLLAALTGFTLIGGTVVGVIVFMQSKTPPTVTTDGQVKAAITPATRAVPPDPNKPPPPWKEPKFGEMITAYAYTTDRKQAVMLQSHKRPHPSEEGGFRVFVYDTATWNAVHTLDLPDTPRVGPMTMTPDGKRVFLAVDEKAVYEWEPGTKKPVKKFDLGSARAADREPKAAPDGKLVERIQLQALSLTPDGKTIAALIQFVENGHLVGQGIRLWNAADGTLLRTVSVRPAEKDWYVYPTLRITDDGRTAGVLWSIADGVSEGQEFIEYDLSDGKEKRRLELSAAIGRGPGTPSVITFAYTPDAKQVVAAGGFRLKDRKWAGEEGPVMDKLRPYSGTVWVIDRPTGKVVKALIEHRSHNVSQIRLSPDGRKLFVTLTLPSRMDRDHGGWNWDDEFVEIQRWDTATWTRDWTKFADKAERWKVLAGADR